MTYSAKAVANSIAGIDVPNSQGAQAPHDERFFCARVMAGCMGALLSAGTLEAGTSNPCNLPPLSLTSLGGGLTSLKDATHATTHTPRTQSPGTIPLAQRRATTNYY